MHSLICTLKPSCNCPLSQEPWLGVEWDKSDRGKHDGSCVDSVTGQLHRYFTCAGPSAGSFIKPNKLAPFQTFLDALHDKYVKMDAPEIIGPDSKVQVY